MSISSTPTELMPGIEEGSPRWILSMLLRDRETLLQHIFNRFYVGRIAAALFLMTASMLTIYGAIMGCNTGWHQAASSAVKLPLLYLLSLLICFPFLFVINTLMGSRIGVLQTLTMIF